MPKPNAAPSSPETRSNRTGLSAEAIEDIAGQLVSKADVQAAYLVHKKVQPLTNEPCYALIIIPHRTWYELDTKGKNQALLSSLSESLTLPEDTYILIADQLMKHRWINTLSAIPQSAILSTHITAS